MRFEQVLQHGRRSQPVVASIASHVPNAISRAISVSGSSFISRRRATRRLMISKVGRSPSGGFVLPS